jgi:hypothetical protein
LADTKILLICVHPWLIPLSISHAGTWLNRRFFFLRSLREQLFEFFYG